MTSTRRRLAALLSAATLATACTGPVASLDVGSKDVSLDLLLGAKKKAASAPVPPLIVPLTPGGFLPTALGPPATTPSTRRGSGRRPSPPTTAPAPCAENPLAVPAETAPDRVSGRPIPTAQYGFRVHGSLSTTGSQVSNQPIEGIGTYEVNNVQTDSLGYLFDVVAGNTAAGKTTTTYRVITNGLDRPYVADPLGAADPVTVPAQGAAVNGIYLTAIKGTDGAGHDISFMPAGHGAQLVRFPVVTGDAITGKAADANYQFSYTAAAGTRTNVDACSTGLQGMAVKITDATLSDGSSTEQIKATYVFGTSYGGLPLEITSEVKADVAGGSATRTIDAIIDQEPKKA